MRNEILLIASAVFIFGCTIPAYKFFGRSGLYCLSAVAAVLANIEVLIFIKAFGIEQTLGNVLFSVSFLITDILSECEGKKEADKAVLIGIVTSVFFLIVSQSWLLYIPAVTDSTMDAIRSIFSRTPRMLLSSLAVYAVSQSFDVWLYHKWWALTAKKCGDSRRFLWLRNNGSTLVSQLINTLLFTTLAFWGTYDVTTVGSIILSSYVIYIFTSLLDTPVVYLARKMRDNSRASADN